MAAAAGGAASARVAKEAELEEGADMRRMFGDEEEGSRPK